MQKKRTQFLFLLVFSIIVSGAILELSVEAKNRHERVNRAQKHQKQRGSNKNGNLDHVPSPFPIYTPSPAPYYGYYPPDHHIFNLLSFGAKGDGVFDDSKALLEAWKAACKVPWATVEIPSEFRFLISPVTLQGPCMPHLVLQIDGTMLAPPNLDEWPKSGLLQWINFKWVQEFTIQGTGTVDGQGSAWWKLSQFQYNQEEFKYSPNTKKKPKHSSRTKPTAVRFYGSFNITVRDIGIINSPQCHLKFDNCIRVEVSNITISSPENSPNTDGIHLQNTQDVKVEHSTIGCGDDCLSIQTGCSNVRINRINCNPGHGISLGGLGKDNSLACVNNITVENITLQNTFYGLRIKTWQGGLGSVRSVSFSNIQVSNVNFPIMIDQYYCDKKLCRNQTGAVAISDVKFNQITGTFATQPIHLACSDSKPCTSVDLFDIQLEPSPESRGFRQALCWNSYGESQGPLVPSSIDCLQRGNRSLYGRLSKSHSHEKSC